MVTLKDKGRQRRNSSVGILVLAFKRASNFLDEWLSGQPSAGPVLSGRIKDVKWNPPEVGSWKLNVDAATLYKYRSIGLGIIIRNGLGGVSAAKSTHLKAMYSPIIAEALAVWHVIAVGWSAALPVERLVLLEASG
ncbi:hypothetical protein LWI29_017094 [Acer saccharum]|uniref:RNase H type-1 domain-containing protein n=1 Tax=Acer saccharum TaxID=4024 RepID=A0AA39RV66_ACESA|nr:hypothetical protein LWI29_017094 [Acer saccharum]